MSVSQFAGSIVEINSINSAEMIRIGMLERLPVALTRQRIEDARGYLSDVAGSIAPVTTTTETTADSGRVVRRKKSVSGIWNASKAGQCYLHASEGKEAKEKYGIKLDIVKTVIVGEGVDKIETTINYEIVANLLWITYGKLTRSEKGNNYRPLGIEYLEEVLISSVGEAYSRLTSIVICADGKNIGHVVTKTDKKGVRKHETIDNMIRNILYRSVDATIRSIKDMGKVYDSVGKIKVGETEDSFRQRIVGQDTRRAAKRYILTETEYNQIRLDNINVCNVMPAEYDAPLPQECDLSPTLEPKDLGKLTDMLFQTETQWETRYLEACSTFTTTRKTLTVEEGYSHDSTRLIGLDATPELSLVSLSESVESAETVVDNYVTLQTQTILPDTNQDRTILRMLAQEFSWSHISKSLGISTKTISKVIARHR